MEPYLLVASDFVRTGGMDVANHALAMHLARTGHSTHLVTHRADDELAGMENINLHLVPRLLGSNFAGEPLIAAEAHRWYRRLHPRVIANGGNCALPDVNWVHYVHAAFAPPRSGSRRKQVERMVKHQWNVLTERRALQRARLIIANSERTKRDLVDRVGISPERCQVVYYGIDSRRFRPPSAEERAQPRTRMGVPDGRVVFVFIGGLGDRRKGFDTLFAAFRDILRTNVDAELWAIGTGVELPVWQAKAKEVPEGSRFRFLGFRADVPELLKACDLLVAPTRYEAYGLGVHEALCTGLPVVVSADAGVSERLSPELSALCLSDPSDIGELAERLRYAASHLSALKEQARAVGAELRTQTWDGMAQRIVELADAVRR